MSERSPLPVSRRTVLTAGTVTVASVAGCSALSSESATLDLTLFNHVDARYTVYVSLYRSDDDLSQSDARVYSERIDVEPEGEARRASVVETRRYLVRYDVFDDDGRLTDKDHVHYYPPDDGDDDEITFDIHPPGDMTRR